MFVYLNHSLRQMFSEHTVSKLEMKAHVTGQHLSNTLPTNFSYDTVDEIIDKLDTEYFVRITFIDPSGTVWGDTAYDGDALKEMGNLQDRPEIQTALAEGKGDVTRFSDIHETDIRHFAISVMRANLLVGVCRVSLPAHRMQGLSKRLRSIYLLAVVIGLAQCLERLEYKSAFCRKDSSTIIRTFTACYRSPRSLA